VEASEVVAACFCCNTASTTTMFSQEVVTVAWTVAKAAAKSDRVTPEAVDAMAMVSGSMGSRVTMAEGGSVWNRP
jgi:streptogramin lyase